ncbi:holo-ACP synthase [Agromyces mariniharenae]|uniref:Holo-[acyl-carrier-protein] synthase n=1 Tax=Agromyces mariniharenae TaxID=2604423 RepID=A0A5S4V181_9MICO|nr:holo-ACP synthase [Agromyces mariniharenae]TYL52867.1 holo-[acyl-carrier-protein] synthase [Agromyces mariniharenae]
MTLRVHVGTDLVTISRIDAMTVKGGRDWLESIWTAQELAYSELRPDRLATRWAAKEATIKALGLGIGRIEPIDIEIVSTSGAAPSLRLSASAERRASEMKVTSMSVSLSHERDLALAYVALLAEE